MHRDCSLCELDVHTQGTRRYGSEESEPIDWIVSPADNAAPGHMTAPGLSEMFAYHATTMANTIKTSLVVFSRKVRPRTDTLSLLCPCILSSMLPYAMGHFYPHGTEEMRFLCLQPLLML
jgi:hypothetical protein